MITEKVLPWLIANVAQLVAAYQIEFKFSNTLIALPLLSALNPCSNSFMPNS